MDIFYEMNFRTVSRYSTAGRLFGAVLYLSIISLTIIGKLILVHVYVQPGMRWASFIA